MLLPDTRELLPLCPTLLSPAEICCKTFGKKRGLVSAFANLWLLRLIFTAKYYNIEPSNSRLKSRECDGFSFNDFAFGHFENFLLKNFFYYATKIIFS